MPRYIIPVRIKRINAQQGSISFTPPIYAGAGRPLQWLVLYCGANPNVEEVIVESANTSENRSSIKISKRLRPVFEIILPRATRRGPVYRSARYHIIFSSKGYPTPCGAMRLVLPCRVFPSRPVRLRRQLVFYHAGNISTDEKQHTCQQLVQRTSEELKGVLCATNRRRSHTCFLPRLVLCSVSVIKHIHVCVRRVSDKCFVFNSLHTSVFVS